MNILEKHREHAPEETEMTLRDVDRLIDAGEFVPMTWPELWKIVYEADTSGQVRKWELIKRDGVLKGIRKPVFPPIGPEMLVFYTEPRSKSNA